MMSKVVAVSGGIGSGKSVVCQILKALGYLVYDCDSMAKQIMEEDDEIKLRLKNEISPDAIDAYGQLNRKSISDVVFSDPEKLSRLNSIVHGAVKNDISRWLENIYGTAFIETAILYQSGIDKMVEEVWEVTAPVTLRVLRVCNRNNVTEEEVMRRIRSQSIEVGKPHPNTKTLINDNSSSLLLQISDLLEEGIKLEE